MTNQKNHQTTANLLGVESELGGKLVVRSTSSGDLGKISLGREGKVGVGTELGGESTSNTAARSGNAELVLLISALALHNGADLVVIGSTVLQGIGTLNTPRGSIVVGVDHTNSQGGLDSTLLALALHGSVESHVALVVDGTNLSLLKLLELLHRALHRESESTTAAVVNGGADLGKVGRVLLLAAGLGGHGNLHVIVDLVLVLEPERSSEALAARRGLRLLTLGGLLLLGEELVSVGRVALHGQGGSQSINVLGIREGHLHVLRSEHKLGVESSVVAVTVHGHLALSGTSGKLLSSMEAQGNSRAGLSSEVHSTALLLVCLIIQKALGQEVLGALAKLVELSHF